MKRKTIWWIAMAIYLFVIFRITVFRSGFSFENLFGGTLNLSLFAEYMRFAQNGSWRVFLYYFLGNIICFIPFGALLCRDKKTGAAGAFIMSLLFSVVIEILQFVFGTGVTEIDDVILNTCGSMIGYYLVRRITD
ncbi:MAG: VanZ family protein [Oscillospiraceae bacterium]|nr:VanZ family protein [Oscillospiraceae bacterium]